MTGLVLEGLSTTEDREKLLHTSHEIWGEMHSLPLGMAGADPRAGLQQELAFAVRFGEGIFTHFAEKVVYGFKALAGKHVDTRDAETIADQVLER